MWLMVVVAAAGAACDDDSSNLLRAITVLDDGTALTVSMSRGNGESLTRLELDGTARWASRLSGTAQHRALTSGFSLHDHVVGIRECHEGFPFNRVSLEGFSLEDGRRLWETGLASFPGDGPFECHSAGGQLIIASIRSRAALHEVVVRNNGFERELDKPYERDRSELISVDPASGQILRRSELPDETIMSRLILDPRIILNYSSGRAFVHDSSGTKEPSMLPPALSGGCVGAGEYVWIGQTSKGEKLLGSAPDADPARATLVELAVPREADVIGCAFYRDRVVIEARVDAPNPENNRSVLWVVDRAGHAETAIPLDAVIWPEFPETFSLGGALTRYVPYLVRTGRGERRAQIVDLERQTIVASQRIDGNLPFVFGVDKLWYLVSDPTTSPRIALIDGETGTLAAATRIHARAGFFDIGPRNVGGGSLWLLGRGWHAANAMPFARFDAASLEPKFRSGEMDIRDAMHDPDLASFPRVWPSGASR